MHRKRKRDNEDNLDIIRQKLRKLEVMLEEAQPRRLRRRRIISSSDESITEDSENEQNIVATPIPAVPVPGLDSAPAASSSSQPHVDAAARDAHARAPAAPPAPSATAPAPAPAENTDATASTESPDPELDPEILALLGDAPKPETKLGKAIHKDLATRWQNILENGLSKEVKDKLLQEYLIPQNCDLLVAPTLNPEVKAALAETMVKRDLALMNKQKQLGIAIAAINQAIEFSVAKESHTKILKSLSDACRLLCDSHYNDTKTRRGFVISAINADMKETIIETKRDKLLFGENISDKLKAAKTIKRSGTELKQVRNEKSQVFNKNNFIKSAKNTNNSRLNWKSLPRKNASKPEAGKSRPSQGQRPAASGGSSSQQREAADQTSARTYRRR